MNQDITITLTRMDFTRLVDDKKIYTPQEFIDILKKIDFKVVEKFHQQYFNCAASFDIETSSFYDEEHNKQAVMYIWMLNISGIICIGRTWKEFVDCMEILAEELGLGADRRFVIYVHNLAYEFQFMRKYFRWQTVFALSERKVARAVTDFGIEFRCSYILTNKSLANVAHDLPNEYNGIAKLIGELNYEEIRSSYTQLSPQELEYCYNDVRIVVYLIYDKLKNENNIANIPLTATGYVRKAVKKNCLYNPVHTKSIAYRHIIENLTLTVEDYLQLKQAFQGGFTHCSCLHSNIKLNNVGSVDLTSAYPAVMIKEKYPMSKFKTYRITSKEQFYKMLTVYCCLFDVEFTNIQSSVTFEHIISESKCKVCEGALVDNGRIVSADKIVISVTEQDFLLYQKYYIWDDMRISNFKYAHKDYLPTLFIESVLSFYKKKTELKDVKGKEREYAESKSLLNSTYGMTVTDICKTDVVYNNDEWGIEIPDYNQLLDKYNNSRSRFINYAWGIWVTAYCRKIIINSIYEEFKTDYVYSDTDSIKFLHSEKHFDFIDKFNKEMIKDVKTALKHHKLPEDSAEPKNIKGEKKPIGCFEFEKLYNTFKSLGAKRYLTEIDDKLSLTCAGLNATQGCEYIDSMDNSFEFFGNSMYIPPDYTGKLTHTYIDHPINGCAVDKDGNMFDYVELSCVHLEKQDYSLSIGRKYAEFLLGVKQYAQN